MIEEGLLRACLLSLVPGIFWLVYLRSLSREQRIPAVFWIYAVLLGWASTQLTLWLSGFLGVDRLMSLSVAPMLIYFVFGVGMVEEGSKALCTVLGLGAIDRARNPLVSLQLSGAVALGFATTENVLYVSQYGEGVLVARFLFSTLGHVLFSSLWGFALGSRGVGLAGGAKRSWSLFLWCLILSGVAHGLYDWLLLTGRMALASVTLILLWMGFRQATLEAYFRQEYERELPYETVECPHCKVLTRAKVSYCTFCGERYEAEVTEPFVLS